MTNIFDILKLDNIAIGEVQSVDEMTVVPLIGSKERPCVVAEPTCLQFESTTGYGSMQFSNTDDKPAIVPCNLMVRGQAGQDHAMSGSGIVLGKSKLTFKDACCIERSQGGYLSSNNNEQDILPVELRKGLLNIGKRREQYYGKLWGDITDWIKKLKLRGNHGGRAHLRDFYDDQDIKVALEDFAAEFEPVSGQVGAVILFGGIPVGLEIMPSEEHWNTYWKHLLRGCYGAELIRLKKIGTLKQSTMVFPDIPSDASPEKVKEILEGFSEHLKQEVVPLLENVNIKTVDKLSSKGGLNARLITTSSGGGGDIILSGPEPIYVSLVI